MNRTRNVLVGAGLLALLVGHMGSTSNRGAWTAPLA